MNRRDLTIIIAVIIVGFVGYWIIERYFYLERMVARDAVVRRDPDNIPYEIVLSGPQFSDADLDHLNRFDSLTNLSLQNSSITDAGLTQISELQRLKSLNLSNTSLSDEGVRHLLKLNNLQILNVAQTKISDKSTASLRKLEKLGLLTLDGCQNLSLDGLKSLISQKQSLAISIRDLGIEYPEYLELLELSTNQNMTYLVDQNSILRQDLNSELQLKWTDDPHQLHLTTTNVDPERETTIQKADLEGISWQANIFDIRITYPNRIRSEALAAIRRFENLMTLTISVDQLSEPGISSIAQCKQLKLISISTESADHNVPLDLAAIGQLKLLKTLRLIKCGLHDEQIAFLKKLPNLETVDLYGNNLSVKSIDTLKNIQTLRSVDLGGNQISDAKIAEFREYLSAKKSDSN